MNDLFYGASRIENIKLSKFHYSSRNRKLCRAESKHRLSPRLISPSAEIGNPKFIERLYPVSPAALEKSQAPSAGEEFKLAPLFQCRVGDKTNRIFLCSSPLSDKLISPAKNYVGNPNSPFVVFAS